MNPARSVGTSAPTPLNDIRVAPAASTERTFSAEWTTQSPTQDRHSSHASPAMVASTSRVTASMMASRSVMTASPSRAYRRSTASILARPAWRGGPRPMGSPAIFDDLPGERLTDQPGPEGEDVGVVVLPAVAGGRDVVAQGRPHPGHLVGHHRRADPGPVDHDPLGALPRGHLLGHREGKVGIVDRLGGVGAAVDHPPALLAQAEGEPLLQPEPAVVGTDGNGTVRRKRACVRSFGRRRGGDGDGVDHARHQCAYGFFAGEVATGHGGDYPTGPVPPEGKPRAVAGGRLAIGNSQFDRTRQRDSLAYRQRAAGGRRLATPSALSESRSLTCCV